MTTRVVDFLNESGGSNFTETAPRPPTYGEENELQSNGGNSTKSSNSHKSQLSNKSHSSSKSGVSARGDHSHSPATTPRKSNLEGVKLLEVMTGHTHASVCDCEENEVAAPLGFEPEGSTANSPPYSENGTPPHLKWAENLNYLLDDSEGVMLFRDFLEHELVGGSEELQFWFACQGFKKRKLDSANTSDHTITDIQKAIYKRYVRSDKVKCISKEVRKEIAEMIASKNSLDSCIFDAAQEEVENYMRNETYPAFLRSNCYVQYVQNYMDSPKSSQSSGSNSARPVSQSGLLPIVHEDKELDSKDFNSSALLSAISKTPLGVKRTETALPTRHTESLTRSTLYRSKTPPYPGHVSYAPVSAQDSELQSLSSDALTDDTVSVTDSSVDGCSNRLIKKPHHRKTVMKNLASQNKEPRTDLHSQFIPRTEHAPKDRNIAETDPKQFAALVIDKLNRVSEEMESTARMEEKLRSINISEMSKSEGADKLMPSFVKQNTSATFIPLPSATEEETAESILDQHCLRIWKSSAHHTPSHSPPGLQSPPHSRSPDRQKDTRKKMMALPASASGVYNSRSYHKKRDFVSYDVDDRNLIVCGTETHRHIHHHHHHHHSSRDSSFKKSQVEVEAQTCGISSWRTDTTPNLSTDFSSGDYTSRGRTSNRKLDSSSTRKCSETSSNIDSGISVMDSVKIAPNWSNPTNEKVMKWMLDSETVHEVAATVQDTDKSSSSHKRSHRPNQSVSSAQQSRPSSKSKTSTRSTSVERGCGVLSAWSGTSTIMPNQPFAQDPSMPLLTPPNPITQLEEARRRLGTQSRTMSSGTSATPVKSKSFASVPQKDKVRLTPGGTPLPPTSHSRVLPPGHTAPTLLDTSDVSHILDSRLGQRNAASSSVQPCSNDTIIGIYMGQEPIPYRHQLPGRAITLAQIKTLVTKRGPYKYYFKRHSDEFGDSAGAVFEEIADDNIIVPMWQGKIVVKVEKLDI